MTLSRRMQVSFLSGFASSWKLQAQPRALGKCSAPRLPPRRRLRLAHQARSFCRTQGTSATPSHAWCVIARAQADSGGSTPVALAGRPKAPPNDPERQGNIWHRYEQLEHATKSLASLNAQLVADKNRHQRVRCGRPARPLPASLRP